MINNIIFIIIILLSLLQIIKKEYFCAVFCLIWAVFNFILVPNSYIEFALWLALNLECLFLELNEMSNKKHYKTFLAVKLVFLAWIMYDIYIRIKIW